jgi:hypothetical protein
VGIGILEGIESQPKFLNRQDAKERHAYPDSDESTSPDATAPRSRREPWT